MSKKEAEFIVYLKNIIFDLKKLLSLLITRLGGVGPTNQIVHDSDFKPSEFEHRFWLDSKSDVEIRFVLKDDVNFTIKLDGF